MTTPPPVTHARVAEAAKTLQNAAAAARACRVEGLPFFVACALLEKESGGRNVYGHDRGGVLSGYPREVDESNYRVFRWLLARPGAVSNGVGPCQVTYPGFFDQMEQQLLRPWVPEDNMRFGFRLLAQAEEETGSWAAAGARYNGGPRPSAAARAYGDDLAARVARWQPRILRTRGA